MNLLQVKRLIRQTKSFFNGENLRISFFSFFIGTLALSAACFFTWLFNKVVILLIFFPIISLFFYHWGKEEGRIEQEKIEQGKRYIEQDNKYQKP